MNPVGNKDSPLCDFCVCVQIAKYVSVVGCFGVFVCVIMFDVKYCTRTVQLPFGDRKDFLYCKEDP